MRKIKLDYQSARLFERLMRQGYIVEDGKMTKPLVTVLRRERVPGIYTGFDQTAKKVVVAMERNIRAVQRRKTLKNTIFKLNF